MHIFVYQNNNFLVIFHIFLHIFNNRDIRFFYIKGDNVMNIFFNLPSLNEINIIDLEIYNKIDSELCKLEDLSRLEQYKKQIHSRRAGIAFFFKNFEYNNCVIKSKNRFGLNNCLSNSTDIYEKELDKIILTKIDCTLNTMYNNIIKNNNKCNKNKLDQIIDRKLGLESLFNNYSENMGFLKRHEKTSENVSYPSQQII